MSVNIRDYVNKDHIESIEEIVKSQSAIIQALSIENSKLEQELQRKDNIIKQTIGTIKELIDDSEDTTCYEITNTVKKLLLEELENGRSDE